MALRSIVLMTRFVFKSMTLTLRLPVPDCDTYAKVPAAFNAMPQLCVLLAPRSSVEVTLAETGLLTSVTENVEFLVAVLGFLSLQRYIRGPDLLRLMHT